MEFHRPAPRKRPVQAIACLVLPLALLACGLLEWQPVQSIGFVGPVSLRPPHLQRAGRIQMKAEAVDAQVVGEDDEDDEEEFEEDDVDEEEEEEEDFDGAYPPEAYKNDFEYDKNPPKSWFERRKIDRHKVNSMFFDMFAKPKNFFPHKLQPGDTVRVYYMDPSAEVEGDRLNIRIADMKETYFDGVILNFRGEYHARTMTLRAMVGKGEMITGMELQFPMHSPLVQKIEVLRRGYIGRNKNAYFIRGMVGKRNVIPLDKERTQMDEMYKALREARREDEIPESEYPQQEWDRYPLPIWKQDMDDWDEEKYNPDHVDQRNDYEREVIGRFKKRVPGPSGKPRDPKKVDSPKR